MIGFDIGCSEVFHGFHFSVIQRQSTI